MKRIIYILIVSAVFIYGIALRIPEVINKNYLFGFDQGWNYRIVQEIVDQHKFRLIGAETSVGSGINGIFHGPGFYYLLAIPYILFNKDPYGGLVLMFIFGISSLIVSFYIGKRMFGRIGGILVLCLISLSPALIPQSRFLWTPHPALLFILLILLCIYNSFKNINFLPISAGIAAIIYHFHLGIATPMIVSVLIYQLIILKSDDRIRIFSRSLFAIFIVFIPAIIFEIRHGFIASHGIVKYILTLFTASNSIHHYSINNHLTNYWTNFTGTFFFYGITNNFYFQFLLFVFSIALSIFYLKKSQKTAQNQVIFYLIILIITSWTMFIFMNNTIWDYYLIPLHVAYIFLLTNIVVNSLNEKHFNKLVLIYILIFGVNLFIGSVIYFKHTYYSDYYDYGGVEKISGKKNLIDYIYKDAHGKQFSVLVFTPPVYTYPFDYMFTWYGKQKYGYTPDIGKSINTYLIIQPDGEKPWSYEGWLQTVIKNGTILDTITLPSGFIVQKRAF